MAKGTMARGALIAARPVPRSYVLLQCFADSRWMCALT
jgi:hypothetical protein